jgi:predicted nucleic acid-binding Zn ribbon protein
VVKKLGAWRDLRPKARTQMAIDYPKKRSSATAVRCAVCDETVSGTNPLCSRECLLEARREIDRNVAVLRLEATGPDERAALSARNGELTSALIGWSP